MKLAISGAAGFLGREAIDYFSAEGKVSVHALTSQANPPPPVEGVTWFSGSLSDPTTLRNWLSGCDAVLHLAERGVPAQTVENPERQVTANLTVLARLICGMREQGIKRILYASSGGALYGSSRDKVSETSALELRTPYAVGKFAAERLLLQLNEMEGWSNSILRIANPYGAHQLGKLKQGLIGMAVEKMYFGKGIPLWVSPKTSKDFLAASDVSRAFSLFLKTPTPGIFNLGSGTSTSLETLFQTLEKITGRKPNIISTPRTLQEAPITALDCTKIKKALGWETTVTLEQGLAQLWAIRCKRATTKQAA